jgi:predicted Fe-Mo cluster-binding NifX family protein
VKVAIPTRGEDLSADVEIRFGRCPRFLIVDSESMEFRVVDNPGATMGGGAGVRAAQLVVDEGVQAVIAGEVGPKAFSVLEAAGIRVLARITGTVRDAVELLDARMVEDTTAPTGPSGQGR